MREFAETEIILPNGPAKNSKFRVNRNPFVKHWFDEIESGRWRRFMALGPTGSGKTLIGFVIPVIYHLMEIRETVLVGVPNDDIARDKWENEILPVIKASRYRDQLPKKGPGSRGGKVKSVTFRNGAVLRFMTGGGRDKSRAAFHCRVLCVSELDGLDETSKTSREADKFSQLERRVSSFGDQALIYLECTPSTEKGRTWVEYTSGTKSRLALRCPHCKAYVTPERENLVGWKEATNVIDAGYQAGIFCSGCGHLWTEHDRRQANEESRLVHRDQKISNDGAIEGAVPKTRIFGFRWTAANNLLVTTAHVAEEEWTASREADEENAEKKLRQFTWALPHEPEKVDLTALDAQIISGRIGDWPRGVVPPDTLWISVGMDLGGHLCHWVAIAWRPGATPHVIDHGRWEVPRELNRAIDISILLALRTFRDEVLEPGWPVGKADATQKFKANVVMIDGGWYDVVALTFSAESGGQFLVSKGFGDGQFPGSGKRTTGSVVVGRGERYEQVKTPEGKLLLEVDANFWKAWTQSRVQTGVGEPSGMTLFLPPPGQKNTHLSFAKHLVSEKQFAQHDPTRGLVITYENQNRTPNHWLDATALACVGGHILGVRLIEPQLPKPPAQPQQPIEEPPVESWVTGHTGRH